MFREVRLRPGRRGGDALIAADNFKLFAGAGAGGWKWSVTSGLGCDVIRHQPTTDPYLVTRAMPGYKASKPQFVTSRHKCSQSAVWRKSNKMQRHKI